MTELQKIFTLPHIIISKDRIYTSHGFYFVSRFVCMILLTNHCIVTLCKNDIFALTSLIYVMDCSEISLFYLGLPDHPTTNEHNKPK